MARVYEETVSAEWVTAVPLDGVWAYIWDIDAQRRHDPRIASLTVTQGHWGDVGSVMSIVPASENGASEPVHVELVAVDPLRSYATRTVLPDVQTLTTVTTEERDGGTVVRTVVLVTTRPLNWIERAAVKSQRTARHVGAQADADRAQRAVEDFYAARG
jgi:hypothetical protein